MKAKYAKPELSVVDFEVNTAISTCTHVDGTSNDENTCGIPGDIFDGKELTAEGSCTTTVDEECKLSALGNIFNS